MPCANCEALRAENDRLRRQVGEFTRAGEIGAVMERFEVPSTSARILLRMYAAGGRAVPVDCLMQTLSTPSASTLSVHVHRLRESLPKDAIRSVKAVGYSLSPGMVSAIMAALEPPILQAERLTDEIEATE